MFKILFLIFYLIFSFFSAPFVFAKESAFVSVVNPVRGGDFWAEKDQTPETAVSGQLEILKQQNIAATWLIRFDGLTDESIVRELKSASSNEKGLFLEITPTWAKKAGVEYHKSENWHSAGSAFLTGYERSEREKLIDSAFLEFKNVFGNYPKSVGAWWIDSYSLDYMQKKYGITVGLIVSDQYTTDNYQIWGQYFSTPYYPDKKNALHPAQSIGSKIPVVLTQWAPRDPLNGYGNGVFESTFSVQANDYKDFHKLDTNYFSSLLDIYTKQKFNQFGQTVVGLENTYNWAKYKEEYKKQIDVLVEKSSRGQLNIVTLSDFASWYQSTFPNLSPPHLIIADDPLGSFKKVVWFMNPYYRAGWFYNQDGSVFRDIRQYIEGEEEICFQKRCDEVNFATSATRVLDEVTYGHKWILDEGKIKDFKVSNIGEKFVINYVNEAGNLRTIEFLQRDISVDGKASSIDGTILNAIKQDPQGQKKIGEFKEGGFSWTFQGVLSKIIKFLFFLFFVCLIPGLVLLNKIFDSEMPIFKRIFLSLTTGIVLLTTLFYVGSLLNLRIIVFIYVLCNLFIFFKLKLFTFLKQNTYKTSDKLTLLSFFVIIAGTVFQNIPMFKNGLVFPFGMGFWGPNTHDGIWHISLINQLIKGVPPQNPIFADTILKNYHFFYDLLIAATVTLTKISILDLIFRFYPILFSLLLGIGTYYLATYLFRNKLSAIFSLYFVYFAGSFGWIVDFIKQKTLAGESAFWANQSISFNLNPPFAISLIIVIAILQFLPYVKKNKISIIIQTILMGTLVAFKAYAAILILLTLLFVGIIKRNRHYILVFFTSLIVSAVLLVSNFSIGKELIIFSPFWLIHSMVDSPDRVGWARLSLARVAGLQTGNWFKFISAEAVGLLLFIGGNLGMRILGLFSLLKVKSIFSNIYLFTAIFSTFSILIPILFIQSGNPWNTIQFTYYGLYVTAVFSGVILTYLVSNLPKLLSGLILFGVIILTPINSITTASYYTGYLPHGRIDAKELEALEFLYNKEEGTILTYPYDPKFKQKISEPWQLFVYDSTAYVSAFSNKAVFLEDEGQNQILLTDYKKRLFASKDFFLRPKIEFLKDNNIKYIYLPKIVNISFNKTSLQVEKIFENDEVLIFQTSK